MRGAVEIMLKWIRVKPHYTGIYSAGDKFTIIRKTLVSGNLPHWLLSIKSEFKTLKEAKEAAQKIEELQCG